MEESCECMDRECIVHSGDTCQNYEETYLLYRVDMEDRTGTAFCNSCHTDAMGTGLFTNSKPNKENQNENK